MVLLCILLDTYRNENNRNETKRKQKKFGQTPKRKYTGNMSAKSYHSSSSGVVTPTYVRDRKGLHTPSSESYVDGVGDEDGDVDELMESFHEVKIKSADGASRSKVIANLHPPTNMSSLQWLARVEQLRESIEHDATKEAMTPIRSDLATGGISDVGSVSVGSCFSLACRAAGVNVPPHVRSVRDMDDRDMVAMAAKPFKVAFVVYAADDSRNHVELVPANATNALVHVKPVTSTSHHHRVFVCTTVQQFFNKGNQWAGYVFYAQPEGFGADLPFSGSQGGGSARPPRAPESIVEDHVRSGGSNVSGGVVRSRKRVIPARSTALDGPVVKNYRTTNAVLFNNVGELFQDSISREYAQQIIEDLFETWGVPLDQPDAVKYAEDLLWSFLVSVTASNKADYNRVFDVPVKPIDRGSESVTEVEADFSKLSVLLASKYGLTRRQFARGVADDLRAFLKLEENQLILPQLATRIGCEPLLAYLAFDGSTHCSNMTSRETTFTKTLESRNLFERDDVVAQGASDRLMQGMSGGVRAVSSR
nr:TPA_asm: P9 protein [Pecan associated jivivirus 1]